VKPYPGCHTQFQSNVGWYPCRLVRDTPMKVGPGPDFHPKRVLRAGSRVGRQSVRNPDARPDPEMRGARNGYAWCYALNGGDAGWLPEDALQADPGGWADGPASVDFEIGTAGKVRHEPRRKILPRFRLGSVRTGERVVHAEEVYLRYAPHGTAFHYLLDGDRVQARWRHPRGYMCVEVLESRTVPAGVRGWVHDRVLHQP
jgi:hypothetical protein